MPFSDIYGPFVSKERLSKSVDFSCHHVHSDLILCICTHAEMQRHDPANIVTLTVPNLHVNDRGFTVCVCVSYNMHT